MDRTTTYARDVKASCVRIIEANVESLATESGLWWEVAQDEAALLNALRLGLRTVGRVSNPLRHCLIFAIADLINDYTEPTATGHVYPSRVFHIYGVASAILDREPKEAAPEPVKREELHDCD